MENLNTGILHKGYCVHDKYSVLLLHSKTSSTETYRVKSNNSKLYFLKLILPAKLHPTAFDDDKNILEIEFLKSIDCPYIVSYNDSAELIYNGYKYSYLVFEFVVGETLCAKLARNPISSSYDIKHIAAGVLKGLDYLHKLPEVIVHNNINPENIILDLSENIIKPKITNFGYARSFLESSKVFNREGLDLRYLASECLNNLYSPQSDLFSVGALMYQMLFGIAPWSKDFTKYESTKNKQSELILNERTKTLNLPNVESRIFDFDSSLLEIIKKSLHSDLKVRYKSASEFLNALLNENMSESNKSAKSMILPKNRLVNPETIDKGKGFEAVAGMNQLKEQLRHDVINAIESPEEYKKHSLGLPNGMLLYGPPGCGKTFFAERFSEEAGYNFIKVISSDLASIYIHGTQEKIGKLFDEARQKAPTILYFDELDAMVPNRETSHLTQTGEVNEFLSQLDNIGESGVFVIGSTNKPDLIDKAILRAGRLEKWYFIPPPDFDARKGLFMLYLKDRPLEFGIDYDKLAELTVNYVSSDIKLVIDESSRKTIRDKAKRITMETLELIIKFQKPTVSLSELKKYDAIRRNIEEDGKNEQDQRPRIGFKHYP